MNSRKHVIGVGSQKNKPIFFNIIVKLAQLDVKTKQLENETNSTESQQPLWVNEQYSVRKQDYSKAEISVHLKMTNMRTGYSTSAYFLEFQLMFRSMRITRKKPLT